MKKNLKIIVTGGAGFIGSHIVDAYISAGHSVAIIDNLSTGFEKNLNPKARFYNADIRDKQRINEIFDIERPDVVNHQAALATVVSGEKNQNAAYEINVIGTINLLTTPTPIKRFIFASTGGAMYGFNAQPRPTSEKVSPHPVSAYGFSKLLAEQAITHFATERKFSYVIFRPANAFGPRQNPKGEAGVIALFTHMMKNSIQPIIYNKKATRDYLYVGDIAAINLAALSGPKNVICNIGTGIETSNEQIFKLIAKQCNYAGEPIYKPARTGEVLHTALNANAARKLFKWKPTIDLIEGIARVYAQKD